MPSPVAAPLCPATPEAADAEAWEGCYRQRYHAYRAAYGKVVCAHKGAGHVTATGTWCLDRDFVAREHRTDEPLAQALATLFAGTSVGDFGAGPGEYGKRLMAANRGIAWEGYDGSDNIEEFTQGHVKYLNLAEPHDLGKMYDWVLSLEVGEHIPKASEAAFVNNLHRHNRRGMVLSWAIPTQGGLGHVNAKAPNETIALMTSMGYVFDQNTTDRLRNSTIEEYWKQELFVFRRPMACLRGNETALVRLVDEPLFDPARTRRLCPILGPDHCTRAGPTTCMAHHAVFQPFLDLQWFGAFDRAWVRDFLGIRTSATYDCLNGLYRRYHLERQLPCNEHDAYANVSGTVYYAGAFPVASEEYLEWIDLLAAVHDTVAARRRFVFLELGARYGTWAVRAARAYELLAARRDLDSSNYRVTGVEGDHIGYEWMLAHMAANGYGGAAGMVTLHRAVSDRDDVMLPMAWEGEARETPSISLVTLLKDYGVGEVALVDMDIQHYELAACQAAGAMAALGSKVRRVHIGTHSVWLHTQLRTLFEGTRQWERVFDHAGTQSGNLWDEGMWTETPWGRVHLNDGVLSYKNKRFA